MYINAVLSYLGAWEKLRHDHPVEFKSLQKVIASSDFRKARARGGKVDTSFMILDGYIRPQRLNLLLAHNFEDAGWHTRTQKGWKKNRPYDMDATQNGIGVDFAFDAAASAESDLFVKFPYFIHAARINLGVVLTATEPIAKCIFGQDNRFEIICERVARIRPMPLRYPFVIIGISDKRTKIRVSELTSDLDRFLVDTIGRSLDEMQLLGEMANYDFKEKQLWCMNRTTSDSHPNHAVGVNRFCNCLACPSAS